MTSYDFIEAVVRIYNFEDPFPMVRNNDRSMKRVGCIVITYLDNIPFIRHDRSHLYAAGGSETAVIAGDRILRTAADHEDYAVHELLALARLRLTRVSAGISTPPTEIFDRLVCDRGIVVCADCNSPPWLHYQPNNEKNQAYQEACGSAFYFQRAHPLRKRGPNALSMITE